jgi:hypothetical protein
MNRGAAYSRAKLLYESYLNDATSRGRRGFPFLEDEDFRHAAADPTLREAAALYRAAIEASRAEKELRDAAIALVQLGMLEHVVGDFTQAERTMREGLSGLSWLPHLIEEDIKAMSACCYHLGILKVRRGARPEGLADLQRAEAIDVALVDLGGVSLVREAIAHLFDLRAAT